MTVLHIWPRLTCWSPVVKDGLVEIGGSLPQQIEVIGKSRHFAHLLTPRECARLMGTDDCRIGAPVNQALFGLGDAVCVPVIKWISRHYPNPVVDIMAEGCGPHSLGIITAWPD